MRKMFDYYIYIDYSENLIGYIIIERSKIEEILPKISKLHHYKNICHKREYISAVKKRFEKEKIKDLLLKWKIISMKSNLEVFVDIIKFIKVNSNCIILISVDNNQYNSFIKLIDIIPHRGNLFIIKESSLKKGSIEHRLSLIIDSMLNIERRRLKRL